jgi:hypothetical protein
MMPNIHELLQYPTVQTVTWLLKQNGRRADNDTSVPKTEAWR